jgi:spermidine/putrescine transport system ATP-binding protein
MRSGEDAMTEPVAAVEIDGVTKRFDEVVAVDRLDLSIGDGEFFALLGPSGCGKTTTLRMIAGLDFPSEGTLRIFGEEVGTLPPNKRPVNTVFQNYALFPHMSIADNVGFGLRMQKVDRRETGIRVAEALELVQLGDMGRRRPDQLSGGQQQRVALARALVNRPKVLLLDEPLGALDLKLRQGMQEELKGLQREVGITFVFVTHDQEEALTMSDRVAILDRGRLLQVGSPETVYEHPANRFVADFIGRANLLEATVKSPTEICLANGSMVACETDHAAGTKVALSLRPERADLSARTGSPSSRGSAPHIDGVVKRVTYVGNAVSYGIGVDWMTIDVRMENRPGQDRFAVGDDVTINWHADAVSVVTE